MRLASGNPASCPDLFCRLLPRAPPAAGSEPPGRHKWSSTAHVCVLQTSACIFLRKAPLALSPLSCSSMSAPVHSLFITLKRSFAGTREHHVRILQSLGLRYRQQTVEQPNVAHIRGAIDKASGRLGSEFVA